MLIPGQFQVCSRETPELVQHGTWVEFGWNLSGFQVCSRCLPDIFQVDPAWNQGGIWVDSCGFQVCSSCFLHVFQVDPGWNLSGIWVDSGGFQVCSNVIFGSDVWLWCDLWYVTLIWSLALMGLVCDFDVIFGLDEWFWFNLWLWCYVLGLMCESHVILGFGWVILIWS